MMNRRQFVMAGSAAAARFRELASLRGLPAVTADGTRVLVKANIEVPEEADAVLAHGADGIGLFRSEFLFLGGHVPDEEEQFRAYKRVIEAMKGRPVTIRTLDIGGDKVLPELGAQDEKNPLLGWRAIRFCLSREDIFKNQLRAILRAAVFGETRIMFPMIATADELERVLLDITHAPSRLSPGELEKLRQRLEAEGILFKIRVLGSNVRNQEEKGSEAAPRAAGQKL